LDKSLNKRSFSFNVLTLAGGTAFAQAIGLLVIPLLTRLYTPYDFGNYSLYTAGFGLLVPLVHFRYAQAIMLPKEDQEALEVLRLSLRLSVFFGVTIFLIFISSDLSFLPLPKIIHQPWVLAIISCALVFGGTIQSYNEWSNRMKNYFLMSLSRVTQTGGMVLSQSAAGLIWGSSFLGLMSGHILGNVLGLAALIKGNNSLKGKPLFFSPLEPLLSSMKRYKRFPLFTYWGNMLDGIASHGTPLMFALYFQSDMVGKYALANTALSAPVMLIGHSIAKVLYQRMSENLKNGLDIRDLVRAVLFRQFLLSLIIGIVIYFFGPALFGFFFGDNWISAGYFAQILIPAMFFQFILSGLTTVLLVKERQGLLLIAQIVLALSTVASILIPGMGGFDETQSLTIFSASRALANLFYIGIICKVARVF
jgi:lipopolysaccharide exporter